MNAYQPPMQQGQLPNAMPQATPTVAVVGVSPESICYNSGDENMYPISGALYNQMCKQLGGNNVRPIPDYITNDKLRKKWLKRGENALLYFIFRKDHYRGQLQTFADTSSCSYCCMSTPKGDNVSPCMLCCTEWNTLCCCMWALVPDTRGKLYAGVTATQSQVGVCCPSCCGTGEFLAVIGRRFTSMGVRGMDYSSGGACCLLCFCQPCVSVKTSVMVRYLYFKRYGKTMTWEQMTAEAAECPEYLNYLTQIKDSAHHPHGRAQHTSHGRYGARTSTITEREWPLALGAVVNDLGHEYYHLPGAIAAHNKYWMGYHRIEMQ